MLKVYERVDTGFERAGDFQAVRVAWFKVAMAKADVQGTTRGEEGISGLESFFKVDECFH